MITLAENGFTLQFAMTKDDYARYAAVANRQQGPAAGLIIFAAALFAAIPVALLFRSIAQHPSDTPIDANSVGTFSLFAFLLGAMTMAFAVSILKRLALRRYIAGTLNAFEAKTAVLDAAGLTINGKISQSKWQWAAISRLTTEKGFVLVWIGRTAVAIPDRSFAGPEVRNAVIAFIRARLAEAGPAA